MSGRVTHSGAANCVFCRKPLPVVNGRLQPWRASNGLFFCNEFCADDAEELNFRNRVGRVGSAIKLST